MKTDTNQPPETNSPQVEAPSEAVIAVAYEKLFGGGRGVARFARSGVRYVRLDAEAILIEQNPRQKSEWAAMARSGHRVAWVMRGDCYLTRVVDGNITVLER